MHRLQSEKPYFPQSIIARGQVQQVKRGVKTPLKNSISPSVLSDRLKTMQHFQASFEQSIQRAQENLESRYFAVKEQLEKIYKRYYSELY